MSANHNPKTWGELFRALGGRKTWFHDPDDDATTNVLMNIDRYLYAETTGIEIKEVSRRFKEWAGGGRCPYDTTAYDFDRAAAYPVRLDFNEDADVYEQVDFTPTEALNALLATTCEETQEMLRSLGFLIPEQDPYILPAFLHAMLDAGDWEAAWVLRDLQDELEQEGEEKFYSYDTFTQEGSWQYR